MQCGEDLFQDSSFPSSEPGFIKHCGTTTDAGDPVTSKVKVIVLEECCAYVTNGDGSLLASGGAQGREAHWGREQGRRSGFFSNGFISLFLVELQ